MKKLKPWLILALVFGAGLAVGVVATRMVVRHYINVALTQPDRLRERVEQNLARRLRLAPEQRSGVHAALVRAQERLRALRVSVQPEFQAILQEARATIATNLTPEQNLKFDQFRAENRQLFEVGPPGQ